MKHQSPFGDTIFALSSGRLPAGVAVIRLSGPHVRGVIEQMAGFVPAPRRLELLSIGDGQGLVIDTGLVAFFPGPSSFTGEDCGEFHLHGGRSVVAAALRALGEMDGLRVAENGEFTRRAFVNGKIDLTGAEALSDLISAETEMQRRLALANAGGRQKELHEGWRRRLIEARALIEAELDFSDEEDVPGSVADQVWDDVGRLKGEIEQYTDGFRKAEIIRDGYKVAIIGAPNAGKSSLLNALAKRDAAIVSDEPGTTRDVVTVTLDLEGLAVVVSDTAGIRDNPGNIEAIGIKRAHAAADAADLTLLLTDVSDPVGFTIPKGVRHVLSVGTKIDLSGDRAGGVDIAISTKTGEGVAELMSVLAERAAKAAGDVGEALPSRLRHVDELKGAIDELATALDTGMPLEVRAESLRMASNRLARITGHIDVEDLLDVIFSTFCVGK